MSNDPRNGSRVFHRARVLAVAAVVGAISLCGWAETQTPYAMINEEAAKADITVKAVRGGVSVLEGSGGNIVALAGADGLLLVDAGIAVSEPRLETALRGISPSPVKYVINTHWHWDHTDGNGWIHKAGATIVAHRNTARHLAQTIRVVEWGHTFTPVSKDYKPTVIVDKEKTLRFGDETVRMRHYVPSHTDGDLSVYFTKANVLATGDTWWNNIYPFIDYVAGGGIDGMIRAADANLSMATEDTMIVPGHGPVGTKAELTEFRDMLVAVRKSVAQLKKQGKSLGQVVQAKPTAPFDARFGQAIIGPDLFVALVYRGV